MPAVADPAVVAQVTKAIQVADVAIPKAQAAILAAKTQDAETTAVQSAQSALEVFEKALETYGVKAPAAAPLEPKPAN